MGQTALTPTEPEPKCDVYAQISALIDPDHPKHAVWISLGTPFAMVEDDDLASLYVPDVGVLYGRMEDCARLAADPTEETLAEILGYEESKAAALAASLPHEPLVVQARDQNDCVVLEMLASLHRLRAASTRCAQCGRVHVMTMEACLKRRQRLIEEEKQAAA